MRRIVRHLVSLGILLLLVACVTRGPLLNSDRIERAFGSYGVEILSELPSRRVSSLYSGSGEQRTTRTYAVVEYLDPTRANYRAEHAAIVAGASIGDTFRRNGWTIRKQNLFVGALEVPEAYRALGELMHIALPAELATHQYLFVVSNEMRSFSYARITEVHHPEYLTADDLRALYGEIILDDSNRDRIHDFIGPPGEK